MKKFQFFLLHFTFFDDIIHSVGYIFLLFIFLSLFSWGPIPSAQRCRVFHFLLAKPISCGIIFLLPTKGSDTMENFFKNLWDAVLNFFKTIFQTVSGFTLDRLIPAILICAAGLLIIVILTRLANKLIQRTKMENPASKLLMSVIRVALYLLLALIVASALGIDVTGVIALASVLTLAISLAVQDALSNIIGGFTLICTRPFTIGDFVEIGGQSGTVTSIGLNYTKLLTVDRKTVSMPNRTIVSSQIINFTTEGTRRVDITVNVAYGNEPEAVMEALKKAAQVSTALQEPAPYAAVSAYNESTVAYILQVWCTADDYWTTLHTVNCNIRNVFKEADIRMTYPHLNVHLDK